MIIDTVNQIHRSSWFTPKQCREYYGVDYQFREIQIHWWNDPSKKPTHNGVVDYQKNKTGGSVNYVASAGRITKMVDEENCAITTQNGNPYGIKIECSPYGTDEDYNTIATLIADIRVRRGNLPLTPHNKYFNTTCPGTLDLQRLDREANKIIEGGNMPQGLTPYQNDILWKMAKGIPPTEEELNNPDYLNSAGLAIETAWNVYGKERYEQGQKPKLECTEDERKFLDLRKKI